MSNARDFLSIKSELSSPPRCIYIALFLKQNIFISSNSFKYIVEKILIYNPSTGSIVYCHVDARKDKCEGIYS